MYEKLKAKIKEKGLNVYTLSSKAQMYPPHVYAAFEGKGVFYPAWKKRIAAVLDTDESIFDDTPPAVQEEGEENDTND